MQKSMMDLVGEELVEPVSPTGQFFNSSVLSLSIISVLEVEVPIDDSFAVKLVKDILLPITPRFSSIMVTDRDGGRQWKRVEVNLQNHIYTPIFPSGMTIEFYQQCFDDYLTKTAGRDLPQSQPLWEIHIVKYPTRNAAGNVIFKINHAIGDGYSLMGALLSSLKRADNPSLPLTFPSVKLRSDSTDYDQKNMFQRFSRILSGVFTTVSDFSWSIWKSSFVQDDQTPIRSGGRGVEFRPISVSTVTFSLDHIKQIKANLGLSVNDVITGIVFLGIRLYMVEMDKESGDAESTALVLLNTRMLRTFKSIEEMAKSDNSDSPWGNRVAFLHVPIPSLTTTTTTSTHDTDPIPILNKTHEIIKKKRHSSTVYLTACLLDLVNKLGGPKAGGRFIHNTLSSSSVAITNMIGPMEKMSLGNHPIGGIYFAVAGNPQNIMVSVISYMGKLRVGLVTDRDFIDSQKLKSHVQRAFHLTLKAAAAACDCEPPISD